MKKFKFLFLAALIAVMFIGCAQQADDDTPIITTGEPEVQPTDIYEAAFFNDIAVNDIVGICLRRKFTFQNDCYELQLSEEIINEELLNAEISGDELSVKRVPNNGSCNLSLYPTCVIIYSTLAKNWHEIVDKCYKKL
jgi:hypothetical protein